MMTRIVVLMCLMAACVSVLRGAGMQAVEEDGSVLLPVQKQGGIMPDEQRQAALSRSVQWQTFTSRYGTWSALWNEATGTPHRAFGPSFRLSTGPLSSPVRARDASLAFIGNQAAVLGVQAGNLRFVRATNVRGKWYVSFVQTHQGRDVLLSELEIRLSGDGRVMAFGSDFYPDISVPATPSLPPAAAASAAVSGLSATDAGITVQTDGTLRILPVTDRGVTRYHLVYEVFVKRAAPPGNFVTYVDAVNGDVVWRQNRVRYEVRGRAEGMIQPLLPTDPFVTRPFTSLQLTLGSLNLVSDSTGAFGGDVVDSVSLSAGLSGPSVNVNRADGADALITQTVHAGDSVLVRWDDTNAHPAERDGFFHANLIHDFITRLDPQFTAISYSMPCAVNINQTCNAFWDGNGVNFFRAGDGCPNTAQMPDVVYHEYGHGINDKLYEQLGRSFGMINGAVHEGMADVAAAMIMDDPRIGRGFFGPGTILRSLLNASRYPRDVSSDPHITGLILGGAFWDLRVATTVQTMRELSHFAKYGLPDDPDNGVAFTEWFLETLIADDDDGNLANGTPNSAAILSAFNAHGIGSALFFRQSFSHTPLPSTDDTTQAYIAVFSLGGVPGTAPDSVRLFYSTDGFASLHAVDAQEVLPATYQASIPPQHDGTLVRYFISAFDPLGATSYVFPSGAPDSGSYRFAVGRQAVEAGVLYATANGTPTGRLYRLDPATGVATLIGPLGVSAIYALAIHPVTQELYGFSGGPTSARVYRLSPLFGDALSEGEVPLPNLRTAVFAGGDTIYMANAANQLYRSVLGDTTYIGSAPGLFYASLAFRRTDGSLWASVRPPVGFRDRIYQIDRETGAANLVGPTGDNLPTPAITFGPGDALFALKGLSTQINTLLSVNTSTGAGLVIGSAGIAGLLTLAMRPDSVTTLVEDASEPVPESFGLEQNYPNPFNGETRIGYRVRPGPARPSVEAGGRTTQSGGGTGVGEWVTLKVYDVLGREVATLVNERKTAGVYTAGFSAASIPSGVYFYRLQVRSDERGENGSFTQVRKMLLLK
jgi:hypothetical protein